MRSENMLRINQFNGLNAAVDRTNTNDFELSRLVDFYQNASTHELIQREPYIDYSPISWPSPVKWFGAFLPSGGYTYLTALGYADNKLRTMRVDVSGTLYTSIAATYGNIKHGIQYLDKFYMLSNGGIFEATAAKLEAGYNDAVLAATPSCSYGCMYKERMFVISTSASDTIYYSAIGDPTSWPGANLIKVSPGDGQDITGVVAIGNDKLLIFKEKSIYVLYVLGTDTSSWQLKPLPKAVGCISFYTIRYFEGLVYFASADGIYRTDGFEIELLSGPLGLVSGIFNNPAFVDQPVHGGIVNRQYVLSWAATYAYNIDLHTWTTWSKTALGYFTDISGGSLYGGSLIPFFDVAVVTGSAASSTRFLGMYDPAVVISNSSTPTDPVSGSLITKIYDLGSPEIFKRWLTVEVLVVGAGTWSFNYITSTGGSSTTQNATVSASTVQVLKFKVFTYAKSLGFRITHSGSYTPARVLGLNVSYAIKIKTAKASANA